MTPLSEVKASWHLFPLSVSTSISVFWITLVCREVKDLESESRQIYNRVAAESLNFQKHFGYREKSKTKSRNHPQVCSWQHGSSASTSPEQRDERRLHISDPSTKQTKTHKYKSKKNKKSKKIIETLTK